MNRQRADLVAGLLVFAAVAVGVLFTWDAYRQQQALQDMGGMMGGSSGMMGSMMGTTPDPLWYLLGTLLVGAVMGGGYLLLRPELGFENENPPAAVAEPTAASGASSATEVDGPAESPAESAVQPTPSILQVLPDDERRVLEPVIEEPGLTQIALRDRADFSKSKISQTVSELEKRGLLYREKQGRTYRVYPADDLES